MTQKIAIIGGGISGLAAAHRLQEISPATEMVLFEASDRLGGVIRTQQQDGCLVESAADCFMTTPPAALQLCQRLGLADELIGTNPQGRGAMVVRAGRLEPIPAGFLVMAPSRLGPLLKTPILNPLGKIRAAGEYFVRKKTDGEDESLQSFVTRRFGKQLFERLVQPLVGGIYSADPSRLSVAATMPRFLDMESQHGSLLKAMLHRQRNQQKSNQINGNASRPEETSGARYGQFATLKRGMSDLIEAIAKQLPPDSIRLDSRVRSISPNQHHGWTVCTGGEQGTEFDVDGIIVAVPAHHATRMLAGVDPEIVDCLSGIEYTSCAVVSLAYHRSQIGHPLNSFGFVVPLIEKRGILSCSFSSIKYAGRAPAGTVLLRAYLGGAVQSELLDQSDEQLMEIAQSELAQLLGIAGQPVLQNLTRQTNAMPQYHVGHRQRVADIEHRLAHFPTLAFAGSALHGVGVPGCIESGERAALRMVEALEPELNVSSQVVSAKR